MMKHPLRLFAVPSCSVQEKEEEEVEELTAAVAADADVADVVVLVEVAVVFDAVSTDTAVFVVAADTDDSELTYPSLEVVTTAAADEDDDDA